MTKNKPNYRYLRSPDQATLAAISKANPQSPMCTPEYAAAMMACGKEPVAILEDNSDCEPNGCLALLSGPPGLRHLVIPTTPHVADPHAFFEYICSFCRSVGASDVRFESFASQAPAIPQSGRGILVEHRFEYRIDLGKRDVVSLLNENRRRNLRTARESGLDLSSGTDHETIDLHCAMVAQTASFARQTGNTARAINRVEMTALVSAGIAEIWQVRQSESVIASCAILRAPDAGYYHSAATSALGRKAGASTVLIVDIAESLCRDGVTTLNLGGAHKDSPGLRRFKSSFGANEIPLQRAHVRLVPGRVRFYRKIRRRLLRTARGPRP